MGVAGSKDDRGVRVLQALPPGFLDEKGKELRNELDFCLEKNGWYFTIAGLALSVPICFRYKTERPFYVAALLSPMADMYYGTLRCKDENEAFAQHYRYLHKRYQTPAWKQQQLEQDDLEGVGGGWKPPQEEQGSSRQQQWQPPQHRQLPSEEEQELQAWTGQPQPPSQQQQQQPPSQQQQPRSGGWWPSWSRERGGGAAGEGPR